MQTADSPVFSCSSPEQAIAILTSVLRELGAPDDDAELEPGLSSHTRQIEAEIRAVRRYLTTLS